MGLQNLGFGDANTNRSYPLSDDASGRADEGVVFPPNLIADLKMIVPESAGINLQLSAATIRGNLVSLVFSAFDEGGVATPVAAFRATTTRPFQKYALEPMYPGAAGWIVFSHTANVADFSGRFSTLAQSRLIPRAAMWFPDTGRVDSASVLGETPLTGLVLLKAGNDIQITETCLEGAETLAPVLATDHPDRCTGATDNAGVRAIMISLGNDLADSLADVLDRYRGDCNGRPESRTCQGPLPIEQIGPVSPDCCGNINIALTGCARISHVTETVTYDEEEDPVSSAELAGIIIDCSLGLESACVSKDRLPDASGNLPSSSDDLCESVVVTSTAPGSAPDPVFSVNAASATAGEDPALPVDDDLATISDYTVAYGGFENLVGLVSNSPTSLNAAIYDPVGGGPTGYYRRVLIEATPLNGGVGYRNNLSVIANYKAEASPTFYAAEVDLDGQTFGYPLIRLARWSNNAWTTLLSRPIDPLPLNLVYTIELNVYPDHLDPVNGWLEATFTQSSVSLNETLGPLFVADYGPADGLFGFGSYKSRTRFTRLLLDNAAAP